MKKLLLATCFLVSLSTFAATQQTGKKNVKKETAVKTDGTVASAKPSGKHAKHFKLHKAAATKKL